MEQKVWEKSIEFNQNASRDDHPDGCQYRGCREVLQKIFHRYAPRMNIAASNMQIGTSEEKR
jgi:hypothetical protein